MPTELAVSAEYLEGMRFTASAGEHAVSMDYPLPGCDSECAGLRPLEVLLSSLAGCAGGTMVVLLRKMEQSFEAMQVNVHGMRQDEHPTVFTEIGLEFELKGDGLDPGAVGRALALAEEKLCPVWAMLKGGPTITSSFKILAD